MLFLFYTYYINQLYKSQAKPNIDFLCHILHRADKFVVASEKIPD